MIYAGAALAAVLAAPVASAYGAPDDALTNALAQGDGPAAAQAIISGGFGQNATILGDAIFRAGIAAVSAGRSDPFAHAVAWGLPHGGVAAVIANEAFGAAASSAATHGITVGQIQAGIEAVTLTNQAYLGAGPTSWTGIGSSTTTTTTNPAAPALTRFRIRPGAMRAGHVHPTVSYADSQAATTTITVVALTGIKRGGLCVAPTGKPKRSTTTCARNDVVGSFAHLDVRGSNSLAVPARVRRALTPGRYRLVAIARSAAGSSPAVNARFTVK
jgi:hypothetical protein